MIRRPPRSTLFPYTNALPICSHAPLFAGMFRRSRIDVADVRVRFFTHNRCRALRVGGGRQDRKSTRLNSSHGYISYAVFCLKKKNKSERDTAVQVDVST